MNIVLDANVLADLFLAFRPRHADARRLLDLLNERSEHVVHIPAHAYLELYSSAISEWRAEPENVVLDKLFRPLHALPIQVVSINLPFVRGHLIRPMPLVTAGDLPYALLSIQDKMLLITEDAKLKDETNRCGGHAVSIEAAEGLLRGLTTG